MNVLVIAAHPDDEVLGCGGTILKHTSKGDRVYCLFLADGESSREAGNISARKKNADQAANVLGISESYYLDFIDNQLDTIPLLKIVTAIETIIAQVQPEFTNINGGLGLFSSRLILDVSGFTLNKASRKELCRGQHTGAKVFCSSDPEDIAENYYCP